MSTTQKEFEEQFFILRDTALFDFPQVTQIIFISDDYQKINEMNNEYGEKIAQINFTGDIAKSLKVESRDSQLVRIYPKNRKEIIRLSKSLKGKENVSYFY